MVRLATALTVVALAGVTAIRADVRPASAAPAAPTFAADVAPILYAHCIACHRPGQAGPFPLITYEDARTHAEEIAEVTSKREMPPWHAARAEGFPELRDERRLTDRQIATLGAWVRGGMPAGDLKKAPVPPAFPSGWSLGIPDLVVQLAHPIGVPATGSDLYRNVVIPIDLPDDRWIEAYDFEPTARRVVHHAVLFVGSATAPIAEDDVVPGVAAMLRGNAAPASGAAAGTGDYPWSVFGVWSPGQTGQRFPEGVARPLPRHSNIVIQFHLHPSGEEAREDGRLALYFTRTPPRHSLIGIQVPPMFGFAAGIDVPAGNPAFVVEDDFTLPVDVEAFGARGHAHYLGHEMKMTARLPGGGSRGLLWIPRWDFGWQDVYFFKTPVHLPKGTVIHSTLSYDNSANNPHNPHAPPVAVHWGRESTDEMGTIVLLVSAPDTAGAEALQRAEVAHLTEQILRRLFKRY